MQVAGRTAIVAGGGGGILPHPEVLEMYRQKSSDYNRWLRGMRRYQAAVLNEAR